MRRFILTPVIAIFICTTAFAAGSIFSGLADFGLWQTFTSSRATGFGGAGLALPDSIGLNFMNPASLAAIQKTRVSIGGYLTSTQMKDPYGVDSEDWAQFDHFGIAIVLRSGLGLGFYVTPASRVDYRYNWQSEAGGVNFTETRSGSGGLSRAGLSLGWKFSQWGKIGLGGAAMFGQVEESRISYTTQSGYDPYIEFLNTQQWLSFTGTFGLLLEPTSRLAIAAIVEPEVPIQLNNDFSYSENDSSVVTDAEYTLAGLYGLGLSFQVSPKVLTSTQLIYRPWSSVTNLPAINDEYQDALELGGGLEWTPGTWDDDFILGRLKYRFGARYESNYVKSQGSSLNGYYGTMGVGIPLHEGRDRIDLSLEYGQRGSVSSNGGEERIIKIRAGISLGEKWFVRPKPTWENN